MATNVTFMKGNQKIRLLRKQLRLTQGDFQDDNFTRGYLGLLENGKRNITYHASRYIAARLMEKAREMGINLAISDDYFSRSVEKDAYIYCENELNKKLGLDELEEIVEIGKKYNLYVVMCKAYRMQGDIYYINKQYMDACRSYLFSLEMQNRINDSSEMNLALIGIGVCKCKLMQYEEALIYLKKVISNSDEIQDRKLIKSALYNCASCYKGKGDLLNAMDCIEKFINEFPNTMDDYDIYIRGLKANCYEHENDIDKAIEIYKEMYDSLSKKKDSYYIKKLAFVCNNLASLEFDKKNYTKALEYYNESQNIRSKYDPEYVSRTLIEKSQIYIEKGLYDEALMIVNLGIEKAKEYNDYSYMAVAYNKLETIYSNMGLLEELKSAINYSIKLYTKLGDKLRCIEEYNKLQKIYFDDDDFKQAKKCTDIIENMLQ